MMDLWMTIRNRILVLSEEKGYTINQLADWAGIPRSSLKNILYGKSQDPKTSTIKKICDGFDMALDEFYATPEFRSLKQYIE